MGAGPRPHADGAVLVGAAERDVLGMHAAAQAGDAGAETGVVEARARGHAVGLLIGQGGERRTHAQRRPAVLGAEGIEVEREGGGGEDKRRRSGETKSYARAHMKDLRAARIMREGRLRSVARLGQPPTLRAEGVDVEARHGRVVKEKITTKAQSRRMVLNYFCFSCPFLQNLFPNLLFCLNLFLKTGIIKNI